MEAPSNNVAECRAMLDALRFVAKSGALVAPGTLVVIGDSALIISFLQRRASPAKRELVLMIEEARGIVR